MNHPNSRAKSNNCSTLCTREIYVKSFTEKSKYTKDSNIKYIAYTDEPGRPDIRAHFNLTGCAVVMAKSTDVSTNLKLRRVFAWHDFRKGVVLFKYSVEVRTGEGRILTGSRNILVRLTIKKVDGNWMVTSIYEPT